VGVVGEKGGGGENLGFPLDRKPKQSSRFDRRLHLLGDRTGRAKS
jgi:hypothetical protein